MDHPKTAMDRYVNAIHDALAVIRADPSPIYVEDAVRIIFASFGLEEREGLRRTPDRVASAWIEYLSGYDVNPAELLTCFEDGAENYDQMVIVKDIPFYSICEHHLAPFFGTASVAYIPAGKVVGLSKINRLVDAFARRLQVQERLTGQIADALGEHLKPVGVGVIVKARHLCIEARGIGQQGHHTVTSALRGALLNDASARTEFFDLAGRP